MCNGCMATCGSMFQVDRSGSGGRGGGRRSGSSPATLSLSLSLSLPSVPGRRTWPHSFSVLLQYSGSASGVPAAHTQTEPLSSHVPLPA